MTGLPRAAMVSARWSSAKMKTTLGAGAARSGQGHLWAGWSGAQGQGHGAERDDEAGQAHVPIQAV